MIARALTALAVTFLLAVPAMAQEEPPPPPAAPPPAVAPAPAPAAAPAAAIGKRFASPGVLEISGGITLSFSGIDEEGFKQKTLTFGLQPQVQYFIMKGLSVGGKFVVDYTKVWQTIGGNDESSSFYSIAILPTVEYNFDLGGRLFPYAGASLGYGHTNAFDGADQMRFIVEGGVKMTFGGAGLLGLGLQVPVTYTKVDGGDFTEAGFAIITRYGIWF